MAVGKVKWFNDEKGWGFIKQDAGPDVFVHYSQISGEGRRRLFEDETVEFELKEGTKGLQARAPHDRFGARFSPIHPPKISSAWARGPRERSGRRAPGAATRRPRCG